MVAQSGHAVADELGSDPIVRREPLAERDPMMGGGRLARYDPQIRRAPSSSGLYDVVDLILDKGIVIDAFVRVSLVGIELLTVDLRVVIASVDTYLRYAEGVERLQVYDRSREKKLPDMIGGGSKKGAIKEGAKKVGKAIVGGDDEEDEDEGKSGEGITGTLSRGVRKLVGSFTGSKHEDEDEDRQERRHNGRGHERDRGSKKDRTSKR